MYNNRTWEAALIANLLQFYQNFELTLFGSPYTEKIDFLKVAYQVSGIELVAI